ncbi:MAG: serine/threonine protein kinase [Deltaproteobacteria bacterium]|nr:serine/threonine protein kinase [Deltaproteobacteria bacterium]
MSIAPPPQPVSLAAGARLSDTYELICLIGRGGMGAVWEAQHLRLPKRVAVKVLREEVVGEDPETFQRFRREAEIASQIGHPHIVEVLDYNVLPDGVPYIVLELLQGESLAQRLRRGPLSLEAVLTLSQQIGSALQATHQRGIIHRDLKPANIFLCPREVGGETRDHAKVLDFGISKIVGDDSVQTQGSGVLGTPRHMAPEQITRQGEIDHRVDQFALATIVFECLSGKPLFPGDVAAALYQAVHQPVAIASRLPSAPASVQRALERALQKDPDRRFPDIAQFVAAFAGAPAAADVECDATLRRKQLPSSSPSPHPGRRHRGWWVGAPLLLLSTLGLAALFVFPRSADERAGLPARFVTAPDGSTGSSALPGSAPDIGASAVMAIGVSPEAATPALAESVAGVRSGPAPAPAAAPAPATPLKEALPAALAAELKEAERMLAAKDFHGADQLARRTLPTLVTSRANSVIVRAACGLGNLDGANSWLHRVAASDRPRVFRECRALGLELAGQR